MGWRRRRKPAQILERPERNARRKRERMLRAMYRAGNNGDHFTRRSCCSTRVVQFRLTSSLRFDCVRVPLLLCVVRHPLRWWHDAYSKLEGTICRAVLLTAGDFQSVVLCRTYVMRRIDGLPLSITCFLSLDYAFSNSFLCPSYSPFDDRRRMSLPTWTLRTRVDIGTTFLSEVKDNPDQEFRRFVLSVNESTAILTPINTSVMRG